VVSVYVHLAYGFDARRWREKWEDGRLIGINEPTPYGYHRARQHGFGVTLSEDAPERLPARVFRLGLRVLLGFDIVHAWSNRARILAADVVWTHTESHHLGVAAVLKVLRRPTAPKLLAQSVWLFDDWDALPWWKRRLYRWLVARADVLTTLSRENAKTAQELFPNTPVEFVPFGICADDLSPVSARETGDDIRVLAVGNDRHRDWPTLVAAVDGLAGATVTIVSHTARQDVVARCSRASVVTVDSNPQLLELYRLADIVVVPLSPNRHASGITVVEEAVLAGVPVVVTDTGGLRDYFNDEAVAYVAPNDVIGMRDTIRALGADPERRQRMAVAAQRRMGSHGLSSESYVRRHCELTLDIIGKPMDFGRLADSGVGPTRQSSA
jgi:glycosyltransferase involved in cell wall biosynthesis